MTARAEKISIAVDRAAMDELRQLVGKRANLSAIFSEALRLHVKRLRLSAVLREMEREKPTTPEGRIAGEKLWQRIVSSSTRAPSRHLPKKKTASSSSSKKRSRKAQNSSSHPS